ncbi:four-helix bundle copper-binding protein [Sphingobacterium thalpophilum]|uniref:four-helix bundle copper-binding protein n=1 Tax=Sphingobacterium thalpophilum TaxID=259 RepID=UPI003C7624E1
MRCTAEKDIAVLARCIALSMECSTICSMLAQLMSMESFYAKKLLSICAEICSNCATECYQHKNIHCQACAKACEACAIACNKLLT